LAPDAKSLALGCQGPYGDGGVDLSAIVQVSVEAEPQELLRVPASALGGEQINRVEFTSLSTLAYTTSGRLDYATETPTVLAPDTLRMLDLETATADAEATFVLEGAAYNLGEVRCSISHARCIVADAFTNGGQLRQFTIGHDGRLTAVTGDAEEHELPPRYLGAY
jgi:hypothetical protein